MINKITAIIPVRSGSQRVKNKNIRNFGNTNLLERKINILKKVKGIEEIIVTSDCDEMLNIATNLGVDIHKRDKYYASSECPNYEYWSHLAKNIGTYENLMMVNCVAPFVNSNTIEKIIEKYSDLDIEYDGITTVNEMKKFFWYLDNNTPVNYDRNNAPNSQLLRSLGEITFAVSICKRKNIIKHQSIYGSNPYLFKLDSIEAFDIDNPHEFILSELLYKNNLLTNDDITCYLDRENNKLQLLDCTIRDGGYINNWEFTDDEVLKCYKAVTEAGYDYFEIGFKTNKELLQGKGKWCYCEEKDITNIRNNYKNGCKIAVMAKMDTFKLTDFVEKTKSDIDMIRILIPSIKIINNKYVDGFSESKLQESRNIAEYCINLGYEVTINIPGADKLNNDNIQVITKYYHDLNLKSLYLADTFGTLDEESTVIIINDIYRELKKYNSNLQIGFHAHNNKQNALNKTIKAIDFGCNIVDSCINGLGRGAGNLCSELLLMELNKKYKSKKFNLLPILKYSENIIRTTAEYTSNSFIFGYNIWYALSSYLGIHPDYITEILEKHNHLDTEKIYNIILKIEEYNKSSCNKYEKNLVNKLK